MPAPRLDLDLFDPQVVNDPYPIYEEIRATGRVVWNGTLGVWMVPGFEDGNDVLTDTGNRFAILSGDPEMIFWFEVPNMIQVDGSEHVRLRRCLAPLFTRQAVAHWERRVREVVDGLLAPLGQGAEEFDLISEFTRIPTIIVAEMLGVPEDRHEDFRRWSNDIVSNLSFGHEDPNALAVMRRTSEEVNAYLSELIERHRRDRPDDLLTAMLGMPEITPEEMRSTSVLLLLAGYDTTAKLMGQALVALEENPDQRALVAADPSLIPSAIEEVLRWSGVAHFTPRRVAQDTEVGGVPLPAGDVVYVLNAAAGRDPARWTDPHRFDIQREAKAHLGFGFGPHLCLGAPLARLEAKVALQGLLAAAPTYRLRDIDYGRAMLVRGPERGILDLAAEPIASAT